MKVLHTADWHLGQKFFHRDRKQEQEAALNWLLDLIVQESIDLLVVAGDVFDTDTPPNYARKLYYNFLTRLAQTACKNVVIVAGNHDSPNMLDASKELFQLLNIHIVGHLPADRAEQVVEVLDASNTLIGVVGAVPYLRDKDIRKGRAGESTQARIERIRDGIKQHYLEIEEALKPYANKNIPVLVTGHLYVAGGERGERQNTIHIGCLDVIDAQHFPASFDYVALGHLHRPQKVGGLEHIRYSGALIPLDFSEINYDHVVTLVEFEGKNIRKVSNKKVPLSRKLRYYKGDLDYIKTKLENVEASEMGLKTWLKLEVETNEFQPNIEEQLQEWLGVGKRPAEIFVCHQRLPVAEAIETPIELQNLIDLSADEIFEMRLDILGPMAEEQREELAGSFKELLHWMQQQDQE